MTSLLKQKKRKLTGKESNPWVKLIVSIVASVSAGLILHYGFGIGRGSDTKVDQTHSGTGDNVAGNKIIMSETKKFSSTQIIEDWEQGPTMPTHANETLNLDNICTLTYVWSEADTSIDLAVNAVPVTITHPEKCREITIGGKGIRLGTNAAVKFGQMKIVSASDSVLTWNLTNKKSHIIVVSGRTFVVSLQKVTDLSSGKEIRHDFQFGISEE